MPDQLSTRILYTRTAITLLLFFVCSPFAPARAGVMEHAGLDDYRNGNFERASEEWEKIVRLEIAQKPETFYYLGNSYYRLKQFGAAALNYRRALLLDPGFAEARQNLSVVEAETNALIAERDFVDTLFRPERANLLLIAASGSVWIAFFLIAAAVLWKVRTALLWTIALSMLCLATAAGIGFSISQNRGSYQDQVTVTSKDRMILSAPASGASSLIRLPQASEATVLQERGPWLYVETSGVEPVRGWIRSEWCQQLWPPVRDKKNPAAISDDGNRELEQKSATSIP